MLIRRDWMKPDGTLISEEEARSWAWTFFLHLKYEPGSRPPRPRVRPESPTAERLDRFTQLERNGIRQMPDSVPVRMRGIPPLRYNLPHAVGRGRRGLDPTPGTALHDPRAIAQFHRGDSPPVHIGPG